MCLSQIRRPIRYVHRQSLLEIVTGGECRIGMPEEPLRLALAVSLDKRGTTSAQPAT